MLSVDRRCRAADRSRHHHHSGPRRARRARAMRRRGRQECRHHLLGICGGGRRQRRDAGRHRGAGETDGHADFRSQCRRISKRGAEGRGHLQPDRRRQAGRMSPLVATKRRIGIVAQSGGIGFAIKHRAKALGVAISYVVSAGNEVRSRRRRISRLHGAGCFDRRDPAVHRGHPRRRQVSRRRQARGGNRKARHRDKSRPLRRRRARRGLAHRQHGRLVRGL